MAEAKEYVKLWLSYESYFEAYDAEAVGNIVLAMLAYRRTGKPPVFDGPERFVWPAIKRDIDEGIKAQAAASAAHRESGKNGGRPKKPDGFSENQKNQIGFSESEENQSKPKSEKESAPLAPPSPSPPATPVFSPPYNPPSEKFSPAIPDGIAAPSQGATHTKRFTPPTLAEVQSYVAERHSPVDPQEFIDFYESKGWMVGKTPMKDWKAACRNAERWDRWAKKPEDKPFVYDYGDLRGSL